MKNILITGGSRGIGKAMVKAFSQQGYRVAFTYKSSKDAADLLSSETGALAIMADSANESDIRSAVSEAALVLASDKASFVTGEVLNVSGGYVI